MKALSANDVIAKLAKRYPNCFVAEQWGPHKLFAIGIREALQSDGIALSERELCYVLKQYATRIMYLRAMVAGSTRVDLQGKPKGVVTREQAALAARSLENQLRARESKAHAISAAKLGPRMAKINIGF